MRTGIPISSDLAGKITPRTRALVVINPNNPTGAVYSRQVLDGIVELARKNRLILLADEIYDKILYDDAEHVAVAAVAPDLLCLTFNGLSKAYRVAGFRSGWMVVSGPRQHARDYIEGLDILANMRLCANVPAQHAIQAALGGRQDVNELVLPGGRLHDQRERAWKLLYDMPGVSCVKPKGALYVFPDWTRRSTPFTTTRSSCSTCCCRSTCLSYRAPDSTGPGRITSASSHCPTSTIWKRRSGDSAGFWTDTAREQSEGLP